MILGKKLSNITIGLNDSSPLECVHVEETKKISSPEDMTSKSTDIVSTQLALDLFFRVGAESIKSIVSFFTYCAKSKKIFDIHFKSVEEIL